MKAMRFLGVLLVLLAVAAVSSAAAPAVGPCTSDGVYDPACDVDHDGDVDIFDIQLTAGHWGQAGTYNIDPYPAMVPKTGQTTSYATGDDGDLEKGIAWPNPRFTDNGNGTVTDNLTGLIWLKNVNCFSSKTWADALTSANTLNSGECGLSDGSAEGAWRLPNLREQQSLIDYGRFNPALPSGHPFTGVVSDLHWWTSTTYALLTSAAWGVDLWNGLPVYPYKTDLHHVWPVRGGP